MEVYHENQRPEIIEANYEENIQDGVEENMIIEDEINTMFVQSYARFAEMGTLYRPKLLKLKINGNTKTIFNKVDEIIKRKILTTKDLQQIHTLIYVGGVTILKAHNQEIKPSHAANNDDYRKKLPPWIIRLQKKINDLRKSLGRLTQAGKEGASRKNKEKGKAILIRYTNETHNTDIEIIDYLKQSLVAMTKRLRKYQKNYKRHIRNKTVIANEKQFYNNLDCSNTETGKKIPTDKEETLNFWKNIWENKPHREAAWMREERRSIGEVRTMDGIEILKREVREAIKKTHNWKGPGGDGIHNYWLKSLPSTTGEILH